MSINGSHRERTSFHKRAKNLGLMENVIKQAIEVYKDEFYRCPKTIGDLLEVLE